MINAAHCSPACIRRAIFTGVAVLIGFGAIVAACAAQEDQRDRDRDRGAPRIQIVPPDGRIRPPLWTLGVDVDNLNTGVRIRRVIPNSAGWRAGLERNDVIVTVDGYQVGIVNGRLYDLGNELQLRAGRTGRVRLLVRNQRDGSLVNLDVRLDPGSTPVPLPAGVIRGTITAREPVALRSGSIVTIKLVDAATRLGSLRPVAETTIRDAERLPLDFALQYDPDDIDASRRYLVQVAITRFGITLFRGQSPFSSGLAARSTGTEILLEPAR